MQFHCYEKIITDEIFCKSVEMDGGRERSCYQKRMWVQFMLGNELKDGLQDFSPQTVGTKFWDKWRWMKLPESLEGKLMNRVEFKLWKYSTSNEWELDERIYRNEVLWTYGRRNKRRRHLQRNNNVLILSKAQDCRKLEHESKNFTVAERILLKNQ